MRLSGRSFNNLYYNYAFNLVRTNFSVVVQKHFRLIGELMARIDTAKRQDLRLRCNGGKQNT